MLLRSLLQCFSLPFTLHYYTLSDFALRFFSLSYFNPKLLLFSRSAFCILILQHVFYSNYVILYYSIFVIVKFRNSQFFFSYKISLLIYIYI